MIYSSILGQFCTQILSYSSWQVQYYLVVICSRNLIKFFLKFKKNFNIHKIEEFSQKLAHKIYNFSISFLISEMQGAMYQMQMHREGKRNTDGKFFFFEDY